MKTSFQILMVAVAGIASAWASAAEAQAPQLSYRAEDALSGFPNDIHLGEVAGVARNSDGDIFVYTRTGNPMVVTGASRYVSHGGSRLFHFDEDGEYEGEWAQGLYGALFAQQLRVDPDDNVWIVDQMASQVVKFDPEGRVAMVLSRKPEAMTVPGRPAPTGDDRPDGQGTEGESFRGPTDVAWDSDGNIYVADGIGNSRIAKYDREGRWIMNWGTRGSGPGEFDVVHGIQIDDQDNIYVADYANSRIQVFDTEGSFQREMTGFGQPSAICISPGPNQLLYVSNSNPPDNLEVAGEIYQVSLDGTVLGRFGTVGKGIGQFGTTNAIDCRDPDNLLIGEIGNWRVQRVELASME